MHMWTRRLKQGIFILTMAAFFSACADDDGADPNIPGSDRDKFTGDWLCKETVAGGTPTTFTISIQKHGNDDTLYVYNFNNIGSPFYAVWLVSGNSVTIPNQTISQVVVSGSGLFNDNAINLTYNSDGESVSAKCTQ
jgi:hypothetical protein